MFAGNRLNDAYAHHRQSARQILRQVDDLRALDAGGRLDLVWAGLEAADTVGLTPIKINSVVVRGHNDHEVGDLAALTLERGWQMRFLEIMPMEGVGMVYDEGLVTSAETQERLEEQFGALEPIETPPGDPARVWRIRGAKGTIGFISPISAPFCEHCNRVRLTADGKLRLCLLRSDEVELRDLMRAGVTDVDELLRVLEVPMESAPRQAASDAPPRRSGRPTPRHSPVPTARPSGTVSTPANEEPAFQLIDSLDALPGGRNGHRTVLLVEDEEPLRRVLKELLEREGYHVVEAADGVHALDEIDRHAPDVVVLDLNLPRLDGYGVLSHLRARAATEHLPVLVLTARGDEDNEERVFEFGADDFLTKPFRPRALSARLRALLKRA